MDNNQRLQELLIMIDNDALPRDLPREDLLILSEAIGWDYDNQCSADDIFEDDEWFDDEDELEEEWEPDEYHILQDSLILDLENLMEAIDKYVDFTHEDMSELRTAASRVLTQLTMTEGE